MAKTFSISAADLTALMALMPAPVHPGEHRRGGYSYDGVILTVEDAGEAAKVAGIIADPQWHNRALSTQLKGYAAYARYKKEIAGIVVDGIPVATDREGQVRTMTMQMMAASVVADPTATFHWKKADGSFAQLPAAQVVAIGKAVVAHVQACFAAEASLSAAISSNPMSVTQARIDAVFAAIQV